MLRIRVISLLVVMALGLGLGGCGKKTQKSKSKAAPRATSMAPVTPEPSRPVARPVLPARPQPAVLTPSQAPPPVVKLTAEAESLTNQVESALRSNNPEAVLAMLPTPSTAKGCPQITRGAFAQWGSLEKAIARTKKQVREAFKRCAALGSWTQAKRTATRQVPQRPLPVSKCKRLIGHGHIYLDFVLGKKSVTVKLSAPARVDDKHWVLLDGLRCHIAGNPYR